MVHVLISLALIAVGCLLLWLGVRQYNHATAQKIDPMFILKWAQQQNKSIGQGIGGVIAVVGVGLGLWGVYYLFTG